MSRPPFPCTRPAGLIDRAYARWGRVDRAKSTGALYDRLAVPILAFVGTNGGGKSLAAVYTLLPTLAGQPWECSNADHLHTHGAACASRRWLSSEPSEVCDCETTWQRVEGGRRSSNWPKAPPSPATGTCCPPSNCATSATWPRSSPYATRLRSFVQLLGVEHTDVLMDEVTGVASSRAHQSLPVQVENLIAQLRRRDARLLWTTPDYGNADNRIRSVTKGVVYCKGFGRRGLAGSPAGCGSRTR